MPSYYRLPSPGVTSISIDGVEHKVDPNTGVVTIEMMTPNLIADLTSRGATAVAGPDASGVAHEEHSSGKTQQDDRARADKARAEEKNASGRPGHTSTPGGTTQTQQRGSHS